MLINRIGVSLFLKLGLRRSQKQFDSVQDRYEEQEF